MPHLIVLRGPIGAGKTSIMHEVQDLVPDSSIVEIDAIKRMADPSGSSAWRRDIALETGGFLVGALLAQNRSVITETHSRWPEQISRFQAVARKMSSVVFTSFLVTAPYEICLERTAKRVVPDTQYVIDEQLVAAYYTNLEPLPGEDVIDTSCTLPAEAAQYIVQSMTTGGVKCAEL